MPTPSPSKPLRGVRVLSLALNLPGPAALLRLRAMGASCLKIEPPAREDSPGDPMASYSRSAYDALHEGIRTRALDLKSARGQAALERELARADVLLTSFRPSALARLGLDWKPLHRRLPALSMVSIVGGPDAQAELPGHDLTYAAQAGLIPGLELPATLLADMSGGLLASEAVLKAVLCQRTGGQGVYQQVALTDAADWLALPRAWGLMAPGGPISGGHAGYGLYPCRDGRVAMAALEPHFAVRLCTLVGITPFDAATTPFAPATREAITAFLLQKTRRQLERLAVQHDIPLHTLARA